MIVPVNKTLADAVAAGDKLYRYVHNRRDVEELAVEKVTPNQVVAVSTFSGARFRLFPHHLAGVSHDKAEAIRYGLDALVYSIDLKQREIQELQRRFDRLQESHVKLKGEPYEAEKPRSGILRTDGQGPTQNTQA